MSRFSMPAWVYRHNNIQFKENDLYSLQIVDKIKEKLKRFHQDDPEVTIVIPAYNEEKNILRTLSSISELKTSYRTELIVANNNSKDKTQEILDRCGVRSVFVKDQGISYARQGGLEAAKAPIIANADADSIYPIEWLDTIIEPLHNSSISCSYGTYSFIPGEENNRLTLALYETAANAFFALKRMQRECVNVMGFNFAYRKADALEVGGFYHQLNRKVTKRSEDGWMAMCLTKKGELQLVESPHARVWTSDRRLMDDGSIGKALYNRAKTEISRIGIYFTPKGEINIEEEKAKKF